MTSIGNGSNDVGTYKFKEKSAKDRLQYAYLAYVNAPDPEHDSLGYMVSAGPQPLHVRVFENFAVFCVGGTSSDLREADDYLDIIAHDTHKDWSTSDFHGLQAAKFLRQVLRMTHTSTMDMDIIATEFIFVDYRSKTGHAVRFDGTMEDFRLGADRFVIRVGTYRKDIWRNISRVIDQNLPDNTARTAQFELTEERLKAEYSDIKNVMVRSVKPAPEL